MKPRPWLVTLGMASAVFLLNAALNGPLFLPGEMVYRGSIEAGYVSMTRFFSAHPNPWGWNPTQYCGLPAQFTYLPAAHYLVAMLHRLAPGSDLGHVYRIVVATFTCLTPVTLLLFVLYFTRSRWSALAAAAACTVFSPTYGFIPQMNFDRGIVYLPWRVQLVVKYGDGPHTLGLALLPLALVAVWAAATGRKYRQVLVASLLLALVALTNWVASMALALCCATLLLAGAGTGKTTGFRASRVLGAGVLAYLLACFWLTPRFMKIVAFNWPVDAFNYQLTGLQIFLLAGLVAGSLMLRRVFWGSPSQTYLCFLTLTVFLFAYITLNYYWYGTSTIPESRRYAVEFELFLFPFLIELLRRGFRSPSAGLRSFAGVAAAVLLYLGGGQAWRYTSQRYARWQPFPKEDTIEYRLARWIAEQHPAGRVYASGGVRFRLNSWFDIPQVGGTFESGLKNRIPVEFAYHIRAGGDPGTGDQEAVLELKAMGVEYLVVNGPRSKEYYRDFRNPRRFEGLLEPVYSDNDDVIYRLPFVSLAHLVLPYELPAYPPVGGAQRFLTPYVAALEDAARPKLRTRWQDANELEIEGPVPEGMLVAAQVTHDWGWTATQDGQPVTIDRDNLGFLDIRARPAAHARIVLQHHGTAEQRVMAAISAVAWIGAVAALFVVGRPLKPRQPSGRLR